MLRDILRCLVRTCAIFISIFAMTDQNATTMCNKLYII